MFFPLFSKRRLINSDFISHKRRKYLIVFIFYINWIFVFNWIFIIVSIFLWDLYLFIWILELPYQFLQKCLLGFWLRLLWICRSVWRRIDVLTTLSLLTHSQSIALHLFNSSIISLSNSCFHCLGLSHCFHCLGLSHCFLVYL